MNSCREGSRLHANKSESYRQAPFLFSSYELHSHLYLQHRAGTACIKPERALSWESRICSNLHFMNILKGNAAGTYQMQEKMNKLDVSAKDI